MKRKVRFNESIASEKFSYRPGEIAVIDKHQADAWIACGTCSDVESDADGLKAQIADLQAQLKGLGNTAAGK
jgi:hypothetical protein